MTKRVHNPKSPWRRGPNCDTPAARLAWLRYCKQRKRNATVARAL